MSDTDDGLLLQRVCELPEPPYAFMDDHPGFPIGTSNSMPASMDWATIFSPFHPGGGSISSLLEDLFTEQPLNEPPPLPPPPPPSPSPPPPPPAAASSRASPEQWVAESNNKSSGKAERLKDVLRRISSERTEFLAQVWVPTIRNSRLMLTTQDQPYAVQPTRWDLVRYRTLSARYAFPATGGGDDALPGLPGRVYTRMLPEWSPNVQFYDARDFLRVQDAARCNVRGTLAVPVIERSTRECLAVIELVANVEKVGYDTEMGMICKALQDVNLSSCADCEAVPEMPRVGREAVFDEISEVLLVVCENHQLPLAQTWITCAQSPSKSSSPSSDQDASIALTTNYAPFYVKDSTLEGFHRACSQQRLEAGQGVAGKAFRTNQPSFISDIKSYSVAEYPLVNHARYFNLGAAVAIRLRSRLTGSDDYVLEFVLPLDCTQDADQRPLLDGLSATMKQASRSLRLVSSKEVLEESSGLDSSRLVEVGRDEDVSGVVVDNDNTIRDVATTTRIGTSAKRRKPSGDAEESSYWSACSLQENGSGTKTMKKKTVEKKRASNEKTVALDVLQQHFAGSLRDAARSIGVCPTTLKRICRQYGISRWPSRKINKVNRSLVKLQGVISSVEGVDRKVKLDSLTGEIASAAAATAAITLKQQNSPGPSTSSEASMKTEPHQGIEGLNVFQGSGSDNSPAKTPELHTSESRLNLNLLPAIKIEPRVHGSYAALSVLDQQAMQLPDYVGNHFSPPPLPAAPPDQSATYHHHLAQDQSQAGGSSYIDWMRLSSPMGSNCFEERAMTVKATLGGDTIRFKPGSEFGFKELKAEVGVRFRLDKEVFTLKYMDDDSEWVVLGGDADLEECLDVMRSTGSRVIKLVVHPLNPSAGSPSYCSVNS